MAVSEFQEKKFSAWSLPDLDENVSKEPVHDATVDTTTMEHNQSTDQLTKKLPSTPKSSLCTSPLSVCLIGTLVGVLINGITLSAILTVWLSTPKATSSHTTIIKNELPIGTILLFAGNLSLLNDSAHVWLYCDGSEVSRSTYQNLFNVIGVIYGAGNGNDTFNLPDFRFRFPLGSTQSNSSVLPAGGNSSHTLTLAEMPAHSHDQGTLGTIASGDHAHGISDPGHNHGGFTDLGPFSGGSYSMNPTSGAGNDGGSHNHVIPMGTTGISILTAGSHSHTIFGSTGAQGSNQAFDKMPPYQTVHYIIRA